MPSPPKNETSEQREKRLARQRKYEAKRKSQDPEEFRRANNEAAKRYRERNPEKVHKATMKWRSKNRDTFNATRRRWRANNIVQALFMEAKSRAKSKGVEFSIDVDDIPPMGDHCPLLGHKFPPTEERNTPYSPSLDRIDPGKGYVKGNVWIVGWRANMLKGDGTAEEHEAIAKAIRQSITHVVGDDSE